MMPISTHLPADITSVGLLGIAVGLVILWVIVSIPVYLAGKIATGGKSTLGEAMVATVLGPIVYVIVLVGADFFLAEILRGGACVLGYVLAFMAWIWVYKRTFRTGWLGGLAIAILAAVVFAIFSIIVGAIFGIIAPTSPLSRV